MNMEAVALFRKRSVEIMNSIQCHMTACNIADEILELSAELKEFEYLTARGLIIKGGN